MGKRQELENFTLLIPIFFDYNTPGKLQKSSRIIKEHPQMLYELRKFIALT